MFGGVNVWRIAEAKEIGEIKFSIDFIHRDAIYMLNIGWLKFGEPRTARQIRQTFLLYGNQMVQLFQAYNSLAISCHMIRKIFEDFVFTPDKLPINTNSCPVKICMHT